MPLPLTPAYGRTTSSASCLLWESCGSLLLSGRNTRYDQELSREGRKTDRSGTCLPHRLRSRPHNRMPRGPLSRVARRHARQLLLYDLCELAHLFFHLDHLLAHIQNNFDSCQVHAHVARQRQDHFQPFQIRIRVEPRISLRARRLQQPHALVQAQGLRMQLVELRDGADHVSCLGPFFRCCWHDVSAQTWFLMSIGTLRASRERKGFRTRSPRSRPNGSREIPCEVLRLRRLKTSKPICSLHHGDSWIPVFSRSLNPGFAEQILPGILLRHFLAVLHQRRYALIGRLRHHHPQLQLARRSARAPRVSFARHPPAPAISHARGDAHVNGFRPPHASFATAGPARGAQFARSAAARAWHVEAHLARGLLDGTGAMAGRARLRRAHRPGAVTGFARVHSGDRELLHRAAQRVPEFNLDLVFQVAARLVFRPTDVAAPRAKKLAEKVPETRPAARPAGSAAEIKSAKVKVHAGIACALPAWIAPRRQILAVEAVLVVHLPLLRVGEHVVSFLDLLEFFLRSFIAGVQVGMVFASQLAKSGADILQARLAGHA